MLFGTLEGALSHRLIEPIYNFERIIRPRIEDGFQVKYVTNRIFLDTWIEWVNMIEFGDDALEEFNFGLSFNYQLVDEPDLQVEIPLQLISNHRGGEIDTSTEPANTYFNLSGGIGFIFPFRHNTIKKIRINTYYAGFTTSEISSGLPFHNGDGWFLNFTGELRWFDLMFSYWHGNQFFAPNGTPIYQSVSFDYANNGYTENSRELLFFRFLYEHDFLHGLTLGLRFEPLVDLNNNLFEHSEALYLRYRTDFILNRRKKP
jgi:hypothetical protein